jgi:hypothetical protein
VAILLAWKTIGQKPVPEKSLIREQAKYEKCEAAGALKRA